MSLEGKVKDDASISTTTSSFSATITTPIPPTVENTMAIANVTPTISPPIKPPFTDQDQPMIDSDGQSPENSTENERTDNKPNQQKQQSLSLGGGGQEEKQGKEQADMPARKKMPKKKRKKASGAAPKSQTPKTKKPKKRSRSKPVKTRSPLPTGKMRQSLARASKSKSKSKHAKTTPPPKTTPRRAAKKQKKLGAGVPRELGEESLRAFFVICTGQFVYQGHVDAMIDCVALYHRENPKGADVILETVCEIVNEALAESEAEVGIEYSVLPLELFQGLIAKEIYTKEEIQKALTDLIKLPSGYSERLIKELDE